MTNRHCRECRHGERGYILLALLLSLALLSIGFTVVIQRVEFEIKRDREEELIHRGVQYSRAVRKFIKAFGRYPNSIEELESTNNIRFLRKRYKDPITGKDFKILHLMDLPTSKPVIGGANVASMVSQHSNPAKGLGIPTEDPGDPLAGEGSDEQPAAPDDESAAAPDPARSNGSGTNSLPQQSAGQLAQAQPTQKSSAGPMVGVVSLSKKTTIREFARKNHYNEWQFVYDPSTDRGGLLATPNQPLLRALQQPKEQNNQSSFHAFGANSGD